MKRAPAIQGQQVIDPAGWKKDEVAATSSWIYQLEGRMLDSLLDEVHGLRRRLGDDPNGLLDVPRDKLPKGEVAELMQQVSADLKDGWGFALLRGLPVQELDKLDIAIAYWSLGAMLGLTTSNNPAGDMIGHVTDLGKDINHPLHRGYQTRALLDYHTDQANAVALLCIQQAKSGGRSKIASAITLYNVMLERHPELLARLSEPFCFSMMGEVDPGKPRFYESPVFNYSEQILSTSFGASHILKGHALQETPDLDDTGQQAVEMVQRLCEELHYSMMLKEGDIQFLNNMTVLHARDEYEDWPEPQRRRNLWRLWLTIDNLRPLTPFQKHWQQGLLLDITERHINLDPVN